jgi:hypothetical protein
MAAPVQNILEGGSIFSGYRKMRYMASLVVVKGAV